MVRFSCEHSVFTIEMAESLDVMNEDDVFPVLEVRVLDENKKTSYRVRRLSNFPIAENIEDMKTALEMYLPDIEHVENWKIGYVLERNKKYTIETDAKLQDAWQHFKDGFQMWLDPYPAKAVAGKRKTGMNAVAGKMCHSILYGVIVFAMWIEFMQVFINFGRKRNARTNHHKGR